MYMDILVPVDFMFEAQTILTACSLALLSEGIRIARSNAIIEITTRSSTRVKPVVLIFFPFIVPPSSLILQNKFKSCEQTTRDILVCDITITPSNIYACDIH